MDRKTQIIESAARIIGNGGIKSFTTKSLGKEVGISEAALYRHFSGKNEIIHAVFDYFEQMIGAKVASTINIDINSRKKIERVFELHKEIFQEYPELVFLLFSEGSFIDEQGLPDKISDILQKKFDLMTFIIREGQQNGEIRDDIDATEFGKLLMGYFRMYILQLRLEGNMNNLNKYCTQFFNTIRQIL